MLTTAKLRSFKPEAKPRKHRDGRGLYVIVRPNGQCWWRFDYRFAGKRKTISFGVYPEVSLAEARAALDDARRTLRGGIDPSAIRKDRKRAATLAARTTFRDVARADLETRKKSLSPNTLRTRTWIVEGILIPALGDRPIVEIDAPELLTVLRALDADGKHATARRAKVIAGQVFRAAILEGRATRDPSGDLKGALTAYTATSHPAITEPDRIGALLRAIDGYDGSPVTKAALQLLALTFVRPGELRKAEWREIDLSGALWRIPAARMKMRSEHLIPLAPQAVSILEALKPLTSQSRYVFPANRTDIRPMSEGTLKAALRRLDYSSKEMTPHGFRAMARTRIDETLRVPPEVIELQLAHVMPGVMGATYARAKYLELRTKMMRDWADLLDTYRRLS